MNNIVPFVLLPNCLPSGFHWRSFFSVSRLIEQTSIVFERAGHVGMVGREGLFPNLERAKIQGFGLGIFSLGIVQYRQIVEAHRDVGMVRS